MEITNLEADWPVFAMGMKTEMAELMQRKVIELRQRKETELRKYLMWK